MLASWIATYTRIDPPPPTMFTTALFALTLLSTAPPAPHAQPPSPCCSTQNPSLKPLVLDVEELGGDCYRLHYAGSNCGVFLGWDGILLIDSGFLKGAPQIEEALTTLWDTWWEENVAALVTRAEAEGREPELPVKPEYLPVRYLLLTHFHQDHVQANPWFGMIGATIIGHESVRLRMSADPSIEDKKVMDPPMQPEGLPTITFDDSLSMHFNGQEVRLFHMPKAHTDGDVAIWLPESNVIFTGDVLNTLSFPFIELSVGARPSQLLAQLDRLFEMLPPDVRIVPGHGASTGINGLKRWAVMLADCDQQMRVAVEAGKNTLDLYNQKLFAEYEGEWGQGTNDSIKGFIQIMWFCYAPKNRRGLGELDLEREGAAAESEALEGAGSEE